MCPSGIASPLRRALLVLRAGARLPLKVGGEKQREEVEDGAGKGGNIIEAAPELA